MSKYKVGEYFPDKRWSVTDFKPWLDVFTQYLNLAAYKLQSEENTMINDPRETQRKLNANRPPSNDPMQQQAKVAKELLEAFLGGDDFGLSLNLEGRTLENGNRELSGDFKFILKAKD